MKNIFKSSFAKIFIIFAALNFILRLIFLVWERKEIEFLPLTLVKLNLVGIFFDFVTFCYIATPFLLYYIAVPSRIFNGKIQQNINKIFYFLFLGIITFSCFSEITFWQEFQTRFNFIAVDYLIYTTEVIQNIVESYPIAWLLSAVILIAAVIFYFTQKIIINEKNETFLQKLRCKSFVPLLSIISFFAIDSAKLTKISENIFRFIKF